MDRRELTIKAAYLFRLSLFVDWPAEKLLPSSLENIRFCIAAEKSEADTIGEILKAKSINNHEIEIVWVDLTTELSMCHLLYISKKTDSVDVYLQAVLNDPVLTIGETEAFYRLGGMVLLFNKENSIHFSINDKRAKTVGIKFRAQLLNLAEEYP